MQNIRQKRSTKAKVLIALGLVLAFLLSTAAGFFLMGGFTAFGGAGPSLLPGRATAAPGYVAEGEVRALRLAPPDATQPEAVTEEALRAYFEKAVAFAKAANLNTIIFEAKNGLHVWWRDSIFPAPAGVTAQDTTLHKLDPLALLCQALADEPIQLWLQLDAYALGSYGPEARGKAVDYADKHAAPAQTHFGATDAGYASLLFDSLSKLPVYYSISGIVFAGFSAGEQATDGDKAAFALPFEDLLSRLAAAFEKAQRPAALALSFADGQGLMDTGFAQNLMGKGLVGYLFPWVEQGPGLAERLAAYGTSGLIVTPPLGEGAALFLFSAAHTAAYAGAVLAILPRDADPAAAQALSAALQPANATLPAFFNIPGELAVTYPAPGATQSGEGLFIMGTSNPTLPLHMDGAEVTNRAEGGYFGVFVQLEEGLNTYTFTQEGATATVQITRSKPSSGGGNSGGDNGDDPGSSGGSSGGKTLPPATAGQAVRVQSTIGTAYTASNSINETFPKGATFVVDGAIATSSGGSYRLKSGDYLPASACETVGGSGLASFTGLSLQPANGGEWLIFEGEGTPGAYVHYGDEDGTLSLTFYDTTLSYAGGLSGTHLVSATVESFPEESRTVLTLQTQNLWGYSLEYTDGATRLFLASPPTRGQNAAKPLEGVRIMLDPGHGGPDDPGAKGLMASSGPWEKDVNLMLAQAIAYRLTQLGAEVIMTRTDDTFPTLQDRLEAQTIHKPHFFLSVHHNAMELDRDLNDIKGVEAFYYHPYNTPPSQQFAQNLMDHISPATGRTARQVSWNYFYVTRTTVCPSVLFEYGFMANPAEFADITSEEGIWNAAFATADGILATIPA